jgi:hypothetical protein
MIVSDFEKLLQESSEASVTFLLPDGSEVPKHFHVTEVGFVRKDFFDCGGARRVDEYCAMQLWVAGDTEHRLVAAKITSILKHTEAALPSKNIDVRVEYQRDSLSLFSIVSAQRIFGKLVFQLGAKQTECLAPDRCGVEGC